MVRDGPPDTATRILDVAERLVQIRGYNGFSYADVAAELGITKAALHYHFASKAELGRALMARYADRFAEALQVVDGQTTDAPARLDAYAALYLEVLRDQRMCLCGMMAAEYATLPVAMQAIVVRFFEDNEQWLVRVLEEGRGSGSLAFAGSSRDMARVIVSGLEGAMLVTRPFGDIARFQTTANGLLAALRAPVRTEGRRRPSSAGTSRSGPST
jgi:TetR/AcrR family transcriptional regulator, transcriptional repressor for nem operon